MAFTPSNSYGPTSTGFFSPGTGNQHDLRPGTGLESSLGVAGRGDCPLFDAVAARKRAEQDAILLANRIRLLKAEEAKTNKKIAETEKRTSEIISLRRRNDEQCAQREADQLSRANAELEARNAQLRQREAHKSAVAQKQKSIQEQKTQSSVDVREHRQAIRQTMHQEKQEMIDIARAKHDAVKSSLLAGAHYRSRSEGAKQEIARCMARDRLDRAERDRAASMEQIVRMEREEQELVHRLQNSQDQHRAAFAQLTDLMQRPEARTPPASLAKRGRSSSALPSARGGDFFPTGARNTTGAANHTNELRSSSARPPRPRPHASSTSLVATRRASAMPWPIAKKPESAQQSARLPSDRSTSAGTSSMGSTGAATPLVENSPQPLTYTTMDGQLLEIPAEEDLDLALLFAC